MFLISLGHLHVRMPRGCVHRASCTYAPWDASCVQRAGEIELTAPHWVIERRATGSTRTSSTAASGASSSRPSASTGSRPPLPAPRSATPRRPPRSPLPTWLLQQPPREGGEGAQKPRSRACRQRGTTTLRVAQKPFFVLRIGVTDTKSQRTSYLHQQGLQRSSASLVASMGESPGHVAR